RGCGPLAVARASGSAFVSEVAAISETVTGYASSTWYGTGVPKGTPPEIVEPLNREINAGLADQAIKTQLTDLGVTPLAFTAAEFRAHIEAETEKWGKVIRAANIKAE